MPVVLTILFILIGVALAFAYLMKPNQDNLRKNRFKVFEHHMIAHQGLWSDNTDTPANSLKAVRAAVKCGFGVTLNVRLTGDKQVVLADFDNLNKVCDINLPIASTDYNEIKAYKIKGTRESLPLLKDVLEEIGGSVPVIIEVPEMADVEPLCSRVAACLEDYSGHVAVMSAYAPCVLWFRNNCSDVLRGQMGKNYFDPRNTTSLTFKEKLWQTFMLDNYKTLPDFLAYDFMDFDAPAMKMARSIYGVETLGYTMTSQKCVDDLKSKFDIVAFEGFTPKEAENILY